jgi:hypothetical protein
MLRVNRHLVLVVATAVAASALLSWGLTSPGTSLGQATDAELPTAEAEQQPTALPVLPTPVPEAPALPPQAPVEPSPTAEEAPPGEAPAAAALPSAGTGGFQSAGGVLMPTFLLAIAGGFLTVSALAGLATTRRKS